MINDEETRVDEENDKILPESSPYLFIHILPVKTGNKAERRVVPAATLSKFDYVEYKKDPGNYKNHKFRVRLHPHDQEKKYCYVLHAADSHFDLQKQIAQKRFAIPNTKLSKTIQDDSVQSSVESADLENVEIEAELKKSKKDRKRTVSLKKQRKTCTEKAILEKYLQDGDNVDENHSENNQDIDAENVNAASTHLQKKAQSDKEIMSSQRKTIKYLEYQLKILRMGIVERNGVDGHNDDESHNSKNSSVNKENNKHFDSLNVFKVHDKIYHFSKEKAETDLEYDNKNYVHLGEGVYCNPVAYSDAFKSKDPFKCLSILSEGVYGLEDLATRCVRKQKNTQNKKLLSPVKRLIIERKVYAYMRIKDKTLSQIDDFLNDLNVKHGKVIHGAAMRLEYKKKLEELEKETEY